MPSPYGSPRHIGTYASMPLFFITAASAFACCLSSGASLYMLSPDIARDGADEQHANKSIPLLSTYCWTLLVEALVVPPMTSWMFFEFKIWILSRAFTGFVAVSSDTISIYQSSPIDSRYSLNVSTPYIEPSRVSSPNPDSDPDTGESSPIFTGPESDSF